MNNIFQRPFSIILSAMTFCGLIYLSSCATKCDTPDVDALNAIYLQFNVDGSATGFTEEELDSLYMVRYQPETYDSLNFPIDTFQFPFDTLNLFLDPDFSDGYKVRLSKEIPRFGTSGPPYYTYYNYEFKSYGQRFRVRLQSIHLEGQYLGDDECDYENLSKTFWLNEDSIDATASTAYVLMNKD